MVRKSVVGIFLIIFFINSGYAEEKQESKDNNELPKSDEKTISKRGIFHLGLHGHPVVPHVHVSPIVPKIPVITKIPTFVKPAVLPAPVIPTTPYHITHGGATVTSYNANYPRVPVFTKTIIPPTLPILPTFPHHHHHHHGLVPSYFPHHHNFLPHHHHAIFPNDFHHHHHSAYPHNHFGHGHFGHGHFDHSVFPHVHLAPKPIVPIAVPIPSHPKIPVYFQPKPVFVNPPKPNYIPVASPQPNPTFIPIPVPANPQPTNPTIISGISPSTSHNNNHINLFPKTQQTPIQTFHNDHQNSQGNWQPIVMTSKPTVTENCPPYNYHAELKPHSSSSSNNFPPTNNFVSGQGPSVSQQLAYYQQQQQQYLNEQQNSYPYPAAAETFSQNYDAPSNDGNYHGLSSYQVPLGVQ